MITITAECIYSDQGAVAHHVSGLDWAVAHRPHETLDRFEALHAVLSTIPAWQDRSLAWPPRRPDIPDARPQGETDMARDGSVALDGSPRIKEFRGAKTDAGRTVVLNAEGYHDMKRNAPEIRQHRIDEAELGDRASKAIREQA